MKDLTEAELIEIERRVRLLVDTLDIDPEGMRFIALKDRFEAASYRSEDVAEDVATLCAHLRAVSIEAQKMENMVAKDTVCAPSR